MSRFERYHRTSSRVFTNKERIVLASTFAAIILLAASAGAVLVLWVLHFFSAPALHHQEQAELVEVTRVGDVSDLGKVSAVSFETADGASGIVSGDADKLKSLGETFELYAIKLPSGSLGLGGSDGFMEAQGVSYSFTEVYAGPANGWSVLWVAGASLALMVLLLVIGSALVGFFFSVTESNAPNFDVRRLERADHLLPDQRVKALTVTLMVVMPLALMVLGGLMMYSFVFPPAAGFHGGYAAFLALTSAPAAGVLSYVTHLFAASVGYHWFGKFSWPNPTKLPFDELRSLDSRGEIEAWLKKQDLEGETFKKMSEGFEGRLGDLVTITREFGPEK